MKTCTIFTLLIVLMLLLTLLAGCVPAEVQSTELPEIILEVLAFLTDFFGGYPLAALVLLVFVDWGLAVFAAILTKTYQWNKLANTYKTNILPYIGGYTVWYIAVNVASAQVSEGRFGEYTYLFSAPMLSVAWGILLLRLGSSIVQNAKKFGYVGEEPIHESKVRWPPG